MTEMMLIFSLAANGLLVFMCAKLSYSILKLDESNKEIMAEFRKLKAVVEAFDDIHSYEGERLN